MENVLEIKGLNLQFPCGKVVVKQGSFSIKKGEIVALLGTSGIGKTVLCRTLIGLPPKSLEIKVDEWSIGEIACTSNEKIEDYNSYLQQVLQQSICKQVGMVWQDPMGSFHPMIPIGKQMMECVKKQNIRKEEQEDQCISLLEKLGIVDAKKRLNDYPYQFSGGQLQRILIGINLLNEPELLIADEPTASLDFQSKKLVLEQLKERKKMGILLVTHEEEVAKIADRILILEDGKIIEQREKKSKIETKFFHSISKKQEKDWILKVQSVSKKWKKKENVFRDVTFTINRGKSYGIMGDSGVGKTTLSHIILGMDKEYRGKVTFRGKTMGWVGQNPNSIVNPYFTIEKIVEEPLKIKKIGTKKERIQQVENILKQVGLSLDIKRKYPMQISGGQLQRVALARCFLQSPDLIIADEITSALDQKTKEILIEQFKKFQKQRGIAYLFISHDKDFLECMCEDNIYDMGG